jgi:outer membrane protein OmpA-like peptidoglycan-associated protein
MRLLTAAALAVLLSGCATAEVTLLPNEASDDANAPKVGAVAVLDPKTGVERGEIKDADMITNTRDHRLHAKRAKSQRWGSLMGLMPKPTRSLTLEFESGTTIITEKSKGDLASLLELWTREHDISDIEVTGYTDTVGKPEDNQRLSEARAESVKEALESQGFKFTEENSSVVGRGENGLLIETPDEVDMPANRRVVIYIR